MKMNKFLIATLCLWLAYATNGSAQGSFVNLNFESATVPVVPVNQGGDNVSVNQGLPGWHAYIGGSEVPTVWHNNLSIGAAAISLFGPHWSSSQILQGDYSAYLRASNGQLPDTVAIAQTGLVPSTTQSLQLFARFSSLEVTFNGQSIPLVQIGAGPNYGIYGGDISPFAGQVGELRFSSSPVPSLGSALIDAIQFSPLAVPEPSTYALLGLGGLLLGLGRWRSSRLK